MAPYIHDDDHSHTHTHPVPDVTGRASRRASFSCGDDLRVSPDGRLAALANAGSLAVIALVIAWEAMARLRHPEPPNALIMIGVAATASLREIIVVMTTGPRADPIVSLLIAGLILWNSHGVFRESTTVLLERHLPASTCRC